MRTGSLAAAILAFTATEPCLAADLSGAAGSGFNIAIGRTAAASEAGRLNADARIVGSFSSASGTLEIQAASHKARDVPRRIVLDGSPEAALLVGAGLLVPIPALPPLPDCDRDWNRLSPGEAELCKRRGQNRLP